MKYKETLHIVVDLMEKNRNSTVENLMPQIESLVTLPKKSESVTIRNADGEPVAIKDLYFKRWMPLVGPKAVEFDKEKSVIGFNVMCDFGYKLWNKQQREIKKQLYFLIDKLELKEIEIKNIANYLTIIKEYRNFIPPTELGFESKDEVLQYLVSIDEHINLKLKASKVLTSF